MTFPLLLLQQDCRFRATIIAGCVRALPLTIIILQLLGGPFLFSRRRQLLFMHIKSLRVQNVHLTVDSFACNLPLKYHRSVRSSTRRVENCVERFHSWATQRRQKNEKLLVVAELSKTSWNKEKKIRFCGSEYLRWRRQHTQIWNFHPCTRHIVKATEKKKKKLAKE